MLHRIHRGKFAANPGYTVVGSGPGPYPDNFRLNTYEEFRFPPMPGRTMQCGECHARDPLPDDRRHPTQQVLPVLEWSAACRGCHDAPSTIAHIETNTAPSGAESCAICHDPGEDQDVLRVHATR